jgi:predicted transposase/invertase (TIGR01784 family)
MKRTLPGIDKINDKLFKKIFGNKENTRDFLKKILPREIKGRLDFSTIKIDPTNYISNEFKESYSDLVVKAKLKSSQGKIIPTNIYFILEHKTKGNVKIFMQILKYMVLIWEQDINENRPLRPIIPVVFYHGKEKWQVPDSFVDQFRVDKEIKQFMLDFRYILFDTNPWDFRDESNLELKDNVFLFTALVLMKAAFKNDPEAVSEIFHFWYDKGLIENKKMVLFFLTYIFHTQEIDRVKLKKMLVDSKIDGGDMMPTLAQQLIKEGEKRGEKRGEVKEKRETARRMLLNNFSVEQVVTITGLTEKEVKALMN